MVQMLPKTPPKSTVFLITLRASRSTEVSFLRFVESEKTLKNVDIVAIVVEGDGACAVK